MVHLLARLTLFPYTTLFRSVTGPPQLSVAVTALSLAAGTRLAHCTVASGAHCVITGAVVSLTVMVWTDRQSTRLNSSHTVISYTVYCLAKLTGTITSASCVT